MNIHGLPIVRLGADFLATKWLIACVTLIVTVALGFGFVSMWRQTYDPAEKVNALSAVPVSHADMKGASACASDIIGAQMRQGFSPSRSALFYAEWKCSLVDRRQ